MIISSHCHGPAKGSDEARYPVIPYPQNLTPGEGHFILDAETRVILMTDDPEILAQAKYLCSILNSATGFGLAPENTGREENINNISFASLVSFLKRTLF